MFEEILKTQSKETIMGLIQMVMASDNRLRFHTYTMGDMYTHQENKCPRCICTRVLAFL